MPHIRPVPMHRATGISLVASRVPICLLDFYCSQHELWLIPSAITVLWPESMSVADSPQQRGFQSNPPLCESWLPSRKVCHRIVAVVATNMA